MSKIYLVCGETGSHDDWERWTVCAYRQRSLAEAHAELCQQWAKEYQSTNSHASFLRPKNPYDKEMRLLSGSIFYGVSEVELRTTVPTGRLP